MNISQQFGKPQDVEWCFEDDQLYFLQSRPITRKIFDSLEYYDGANIQESFNGVVQPLAYTLAKYGYPFAYKQALVNVGVSRDYLDENNQVFDTLLKLWYGRMYYNMDSWYGMTSFVPGNNKSNFNTMMTSNIQDANEGKIRPISKIKFYWNVLWEYLRMQRRVDSFVSDAKEKIGQFNKKDVNKLTYEDCVKEMKDFQSEFLPRWYIVGENDFCVSATFGHLNKKFNPDVLRHLIWVESASTQQSHDLADLAKDIMGQEDLADAISRRDREFYDCKLKSHPEIKQSVETYFEKYGGRMADEQKLEKLDIRDDFNTWAGMIKAYANVDPNSERPNQEGVDLPRIGLIDRFVISRFKKHAVNREELRLVRSNFFGVMRKLFTQIGVRLEEAGVIDNSRDVFFLHFEEIHGKDTLDQFEGLQNEVKERREEYATYDDMNPPSHFVSVNGAGPEIEELVLDEDKKLFFGTGSSPGKVVVRAKVFKEFYMPNDDNDFGMVAKNTDPGWTPLIKLTKGMIIENGGVLSHAAIVSREEGIPTVIGVPYATDYFKDGMLVEIDGSKGTVKILE